MMFEIGAADQSAIWTYDECTHSSDVMTALDSAMSLKA